MLLVEKLPIPTRIQCHSKVIGEFFFKLNVLILSSQGKPYSGCHCSDTVPGHYYKKRNGVACVGRWSRSPDRSEEELVQKIMKPR